jgi:sugar/nucleoside kinase (ribokinase family)
MAFDVVGVGASCVDQICLLRVFPEASGPKSKIRMRGQRLACGGQTATALATCRRFGLTASYIGAVGTDENGRLILAELASWGIDTTHVCQVPVPSATAIILIDASGERIVLWHRDPNLCFPTEHLPAETLAAASALLVDDVDEEAAIAAARLAHGAGVPVVCDVDHVTSRTWDLLGQTSWAILAEHVPEQLTGVAGSNQAARALSLKLGVPVVVTLGARGALGVVGEDVAHAPAYRVPAVDTTGAGDVFRGAFIYGLLQRWPIEAMLQFANAAAAASCTRLGAMGGVPDLGEVERLRAGR